VEQEVFKRAVWSLRAQVEPDDTGMNRDSTLAKMEVAEGQRKELVDPFAGSGSGYGWGVGVRIRVRVRVRIGVSIRVRVRTQG
jgi:hypothetical protein